MNSLAPARRGFDTCKYLRDDFLFLGGGMDGQGQRQNLFRFASNDNDRPDVIGYWFFFCSSRVLADEHESFWVHSRSSRRSRGSRYRLATVGEEKSSLHSLDYLFFRNQQSFVPRGEIYEHNLCIKIAYCKPAEINFPGHQKTPAVKRVVLQPVRLATFLRRHVEQHVVPSPLGVQRRSQHG